MYNRPENYEEAKKIIREIDNDKKFNARYYRAYALRGGITAAVGAGLGYVLSVLYGIPEMASDLVPLAASLVGIAGFAPLLGIKKVGNDIKKGTFFKEHTREEVMELANEYISAYNEYEAKKEGKTRQC